MEDFFKKLWFVLKLTGLYLVLSSPFLFMWGREIYYQNRTDLMQHVKIIQVDSVYITKMVPSSSQESVGDIVSYWSYTVHYQDSCGNMVKKPLEGPYRPRKGKAKIITNKDNAIIWYEALAE